MGPLEVPDKKQQKKKGLIQSLCLAEDIPSMKYSTAVSMHVV